MSAETASDMSVLLTGRSGVLEQERVTILTGRSGIGTRWHHEGSSFFKVWRIMDEEFGGRCDRVGSGRRRSNAVEWGVFIPLREIQSTLARSGFHTQVHERARKPTQGGRPLLVGQGFDVHHGDFSCASRALANTWRQDLRDMQAGEWALGTGSCEVDRNKININNKKRQDLRDMDAGEWALGTGS